MDKKVLFAFRMHAFVYDHKLYAKLEAHIQKNLSAFWISIDDSLKNIYAV